MPGSERRRGDSFIASRARFGWSDPVVSLGDGFLKGGLSLTPGIRRGRGVHAVTIPIEVAEIGRRDPTPKRLLCARRAFELTVQLYAQRTLRLARLHGQSSCSNNPHREGRNRSVGSARCAPAVRPLCARCALAGIFGDSGRLQRRFPGAEQPAASVRGRGCGSPPLESSCPNNPHRGARNWSLRSDSKTTLVHPQGARRPSGRLQSDSRSDSVGCWAPSRLMNDGITLVERHRRGQV